MSKVFEALQRVETSGVCPVDLTETCEILRTAIPNRNEIVAPGEERADNPIESQPEPPTTPQNSDDRDVNAVAVEVAPERREVRVRISSDSPFMPFDKDHAKAAEQYRIIRTKIVQHPLSHRVIAVCSVDPGDGKTVTSVNIAAALALKNDVKVLLVEGDLRRGSLAEHLGVPATPGLAEILTGGSTSDEAIVQIQQLPNLNILTAGTRPVNPGEILDSPRWRLLMQHFRAQYDYVLIDALPIGFVADCDLIQEVSDGIILVVRQDHSSRSYCKNLIARFPREKLVGVVLNCVENPFWVRDQGYYGYEAAAAV